MPDTREDSQPYGKLGIIGMRGSEDFVRKADAWIREWRGADGSFMVEAECPRFATGEGKGIIHRTVRGHDVYIFADCFNYGVTYRMYGMDVPMSPDEHFQDLKRVIAACGGKPRRITVVMPMLYEGRQHKRNYRESLDCAISLHELVDMGVTNIVTFDAHDARVQNAIPFKGFESIQPSYQMIKALIRSVPDISLQGGRTVIVSPDEGGLPRCMYYSSILGLELCAFYKLRDFTRFVDGRNPIVSHEFLGDDIRGKDAIIIDDMISNGDSIIDVAEQLKGRGAARIFIFATFGLFTGGLGAFDEKYAEGLFDMIFTTNLIYTPKELLAREWYRCADLSKFIAYIIDNLNYDRTLSGILDPAEKIKAIVGDRA
ncbi:MAG: ribose-phosphate pyrophosphokinase [Oscillospiraceae bacterium]|nr:ribose-phosphate pyrophosphokinase [Oscillospiraceae bacterium]